MSADGSRLISALLKRANHQVKSVFYARRESNGHPEPELVELAPLLEESDLVLVAVYSRYINRAIKLTDYIHKKYPHKLVIWGGPHCISVPELSLAYADGVCFSDGDEAVVDFVNRLESGQNYLETPNMGFSVNGSYIINEALPPFKELDSLPYYDFDLKDHFLLDRKLTPMTKEMLRDGHAVYPFNRPILFTITSRGCPHNCSYCNNCRYVSMFGHNKIRSYSISRIIKELKYTLEKFDFFHLVGIGDDDFFVRPTEEIKDFAKQYKEYIGLPFGIAVSANTYRQEKVEPLLDAGLKVIQMGVQSGSERVLIEVYNRKISLSRTRAVIKEIEPYMKKFDLMLLLDFIIDNPYETKDDIIQTYNFILCLPPGVTFNVFFLAFFPGTPLYERAIEDGFIEKNDAISFRFYSSSGTKFRYQKNYESFLILLVKKLYTRFPQKVPGMLPFLRFLGSTPLRKAGSILPGSFYASLSKLINIYKT
jgi:radical SAM superfamily enzyme YgiQ (UPF0313 family)